MRHKGAAERTAVSRPDRSVIMRLDVSFDPVKLICDRDVALGICFVKARIGNGCNQKVLAELVNDAAEISFPVTHRSRQEQDHRI